MRICYVINSLEGGGAAAPIPAVAGLLRDQGHEVRILALTLRDGRGRAAIEAAGFAVVVRAGGERDHLAALRWLDRAITAERPDVIWTSLTRATLLGQIVGQIRRIAVVSWQHAAFLKPMNALLLRRRQRRSLLWIADSSNVAALTQSRLGVEPERVAVWPLFAAAADAPQATAWQPGQAIRIGSLGRLHPVKGYDVLLSALARLKAGGDAPKVPIEVSIAGDGALNDELIAQAKALGLSEVRFVGFVEPRAFLAGLHLYVQPSRSEGLCIAAHEAMAAGLPIVASAVGELPRTIVEGATGSTVPQGNPAALAQALATLLARPERLAAIGEASRQRVLDLFGAAAFARAGEDVLRRINRALSPAAASDRRL